MAIKTVAEKTGESSRIISWLFFYFAGAIENSLQPSIWWKRENEWRLNKIGFNLPEAKRHWENIFPVLHEVLRDLEEELKIHILTGKTMDQKTKQLSLFNIEGII